MAIVKKTELVLDHVFDPRTCRHHLNGFVHVLHCHHFSTLYSRLADDCGMLDGKKLLADVAEDTFGQLLADYFAQNGIEGCTDRFAIAEQYYTAAGLGKMEIVCAGTDSGEVRLVHSHVDEGWIKKWGKRDTPVNFITQGFIAGMFNAVFGRPPRTYEVMETASIVAGAENSRFQVVAR